jgi:hypothetical protein
MKKNLEKTLVEMFGDPIDPKFGTKIGQVPDITRVGAVGVRDVGMNDDLGGVCPDCGMMSIEGKCGCEEMPEPEEHHEPLAEMCHGCGMPVEQCMCGSKETCPACGMSPCNCDSHDDNVCSSCSMMSTDIEAPSCGCLSTGDEMIEGIVEETCSECGMSEATCECGMNEASKACSECGMDESVCECGMNEGKKKKGPSKKTAKKILRGTKTFKDKMEKVSGWAEDPAAAAAWMMHKATKKWPSEK